MEVVKVNLRNLISSGWWSRWWIPSFPRIVKRCTAEEIAFFRLSNPVADRRSCQGGLHHRHVISKSCDSEQSIRVTAVAHRVRTILELSFVSSLPLAPHAMQRLKFWEFILTLRLLIVFQNQLKVWDHVLSFESASFCHGCDHTRVQMRERCRWVRKPEVFPEPSSPSPPHLLLLPVGSTFSPLGPFWADFKSKLFTFDFSR